MQGCGNDYVYVDGFHHERAPTRSALAPAHQRPALRRGQRRADPGPAQRQGRRPHADVERRRQRVGDVRQRHPLRGEVRLRPRPRARRSPGSRSRPARGVLDLDLGAKDGERGERVTVDMGAPRLERARDPDGRAPAGRVVDEAARAWTARRSASPCVSMGNPHVRRRTCDDVAGGPGRDATARCSRRHAVLPAPHERRLRARCSRAARCASARGSAARARRCACGTGACAVGRRRRADRPHRPRRATLHLLGGDLASPGPRAGTCFKTGPAVEVFEGRWPARPAVGPDRRCPSATSAAAARWRPRRLEGVDVEECELCGAPAGRRRARSPGRGAPRGARAGLRPRRLPAGAARSSTSRPSASRAPPQARRAAASTRTCSCASTPRASSDLERLLTSLEMANHATKRRWVVECALQRGLLFILRPRFWKPVTRSRPRTSASRAPTSPCWPRCCART